MKALYAFGFEKAVVLNQTVRATGLREIHFCESHGHFLDEKVNLRVQKPWPARQLCVPDRAISTHRMFWIHLIVFLHSGSAMTCYVPFSVRIGLFANS